MKERMLKKRFQSTFVILLILLAQVGEAQTPNYPKLNVYLDCMRCDKEYLQQELSYINFVRDQKDADVYVMVLTQETGSGGTEYELEFTGQNEFGDLYYRSSYMVDVNATYDETREEMKMHLEMGLGNFWSFMFRKVRPYNPEDTLANNTEMVTESIEDKDKWNSWVFQLGLNGSISGLETATTTKIMSSASAKRVTEKNKFYLKASWDKDKSERTYKSYNSDVDVTKTFIKENQSLIISDAFSISRLWSLGAFAETGRSTFSNYDLYMKFKPGLEFSFFPYEEATRKQITLSYKFGSVYNDYIEETIFNKNEELLWEHSLEAGGTVKQKWGTISGSVVYDVFSHDKKLYALNFNLSANWRIFKGLSLNFMSRYNITHNQVNISGEGFTVEQILLRQKQELSGYNYYTSIGFSYTFGSMFNPVVNPRFGF